MTLIFGLFESGATKRITFNNIEYILRKGFSPDEVFKEYITPDGKYSWLYVETKLGFGRASLVKYRGK